MIESLLCTKVVWKNIVNKTEQNTQLIVADLYIEQFSKDYVVI